MAESQVGIVTPVAPEAPVVESTPALEPTVGQEAEVTSEGEQPEAQPDRTFTQKELDAILTKRLAKESRRYEREARDRAELIARATVAEQRLQQQQPQAQAQPSGAPQPAQFQDYESYIEALTEWKVDQRFAGYRQETEAQAIDRQNREQAAQVKQRLSEGGKEYEDFDEVVFAKDVPISQPMAAGIADSEVGWKVAYHLAQNIEEANRIARLPPIKQIRELIKLETTLTATPAPTKTPPPIVPSSGKSAVSKDTFDFNPENTKEWDAFMAKRKKERSRR